MMYGEQLCSRVKYNLQNTTYCIIQKLLLRFYIRLLRYMETINYCVALFLIILYYLNTLGLFARVPKKSEFLLK